MVYQITSKKLIQCKLQEFPLEKDKTAPHVEQILSQLFPISLLYFAWVYILDAVKTKADIGKLLGKQFRLKS